MVHDLVSIVNVHNNHSLALRFELRRNSFVYCVCIFILGFEVFSFNESHTVELTNWIAHRPWSHFVVGPVLVPAVILVNQPQAIPVGVEILKRCFLLHWTLLVKCHYVANHIESYVGCGYLYLDTL